MSAGGVGAVIVAAGRSTRLPGRVPKPFRTLGGRWMVEYAVAAFGRCPRVDATAVVVAPDQVPAVRERLGARVAAVVAGGDQRRQSVAAGLAALPEAAWIVVHDGARPFVSEALIARVLDAAVRTGAATVGLPLTDTVKEVAGDRVRRTVDRTSLWTVQTPQAFRADLLREAHRRVPTDAPVTDDAGLVERIGGEVAVVPGDPRNLKVTTADDLERARDQLVAEAAPVRVGLGYDVHRFAPDRPLVLGGVRIAHPRGLEGHSDADALAHAVADAVLGASGERDIGRQFPPDDPAYRGADSIGLLAQAAARARDAGWEVANVDAVVVAEAPRLAPYVDAMCARIAAALGVPTDRVAVKATTSEGLGALGRGDGVAAHAVVLVRRLS